MFISITGLHSFANNCDKKSMDGVLYVKTLFIHSVLSIENFNTFLWINYILIITCIIHLYRMVLCSLHIDILPLFRTATMMPCTRFRHLNVYAAPHGGNDETG